ncbi:hypothetical protein GCM10011514_25190 [Emticicia aquatilis]|uniref:DUF1211 domain-containing protein n=1 Tax=Emticicia aquatilis TaxID=1537369 RepID=A0A917DQK3_9BACT|nr:TMEM175 family protein [Emticicia aquatilis]GGD60203.1 hypothetical protein GCM10011514_25190 [Emticicia aquatilis]
MKMYHKKEIAYERILFFSDAVVAIAITLLALELKIEVPTDKPLSFADLLAPWHQYLAFILSFLNIAGFWKTHHDFFICIKRMDEKLLYLNILWLFFIVALPFSTSVLSNHFGNTPAIFLYSLNIFFISVCQNFIWDYSADRTDFMDKENIDTSYQANTRIMLNLDMLNGLIAVITAFFFPKAAFFFLFFKLPVFVFAALYIGGNRRNERKKLRR